MASNIDHQAGLSKLRYSTKQMARLGNRYIDMMFRGTDCGTPSTLAPNLRCGRLDWIGVQ